ncbi:MAG: tetratricopeptide repeat protein [bacterium]|nr:tetratricopeptide repeat protein [bacterium]
MAGADNRKGLLAKVGLAVMTTALTLVALEVAVRALRPTAADGGGRPGVTAEVRPVDAGRLLDELAGDDPLTAQTFNIYYFGGSTMASRSFIRLIGHVLGPEIDGRPVRALRVATDAKDLQFNYARLKTILDARERFHPDICVIYSGHNEFLRYHNPKDGVLFSRSYGGPAGRLAARSALVRELLDRTSSYRLEIDERRFFDEPLFDRDGYAAVVDDYRARLGRMTDWSNEAGIPVVVSTVAGNYADWEPNRSIFCGRDEEQAAFHELMQDGERSRAGGDLVTAAERYGRALEICPEFAEAHFRLGQVLESQGRLDEARQSFADAVDHDGMPMRATTAQNEFIRELGASGRARVVDAVAVLRQEAPGGRIGFNLMVDGHHPNARGYELIATSIAREIAAAYAVPEERLTFPERTEAARLLGWGDRSRVFRRRIGFGRWFTRLATWRHDPDARLNNAEDSFIAARRMDGSRYEPYLGMAIVAYLRDDTLRAEEFLRTARAIDERAVDRYLERPWIEKVVRRAQSQSAQR